MARLLFAQSYFLRFDAKLWRAMQPYPPLGSLYAAAYARAQGHEVRFFDAMLAPGPAALTPLLAGTDVLVIFDDNFNYLSKMCLGRMRNAALHMLRAARARGIPALVCSSDASDHPEPYLKAGADAVLLGEGEPAMGEALVALSSGQSLANIAGVALPDGTRTPKRAVLRDLDALPAPAWDLVDLERYRRLWQQRHGRFSLNLVTTRGCPYHCNWCAKPIWGQRYASRSPVSVAHEVASVSRQYGVQHIRFADDIMGLKPGWLRHFADALTALNARVPFTCLSRADLLLRDGDIAALARAGCEEVWLGAESGSQAILDAMEKGTTVEQIEAATRALRAHGIRAAYFVQLGYPGESAADLAATLALLRRNLPDDIGISVSYPLPGTSFHARVKSDLGARAHWRDSSDLAMLYRGPHPTAFYRRMHRFVHADLALHRGLAQRSVAPRRLARLARAAIAWPVHKAAVELLARWPHTPGHALAPELSLEQAGAPTPQ